MQDEKFNLNEPDIFSENIRQKLENYSMPVDASAWAEIESRLKARKKAFPIWWWFSGVAAVATFALLFTLRLADDSVKLAQNSTQKLDGSKNTNLKPLSSSKPELISKISPKKTAKIPSIIKCTFENGVQSSMEIPAVSSSKDSTTIAPKLQNTVETKNDIAVANVIDSASTISKKKYIPGTLTEIADDNPLGKSATKNEWLLAVAIGSDRISSIGGSPNYLTANVGRRNLVSAHPNYTSILTPNHFSNKNFLPPLSVGIAIRKNLTNTTSIESGLVYTYLLSTFDTPGSTSYDATSQLHYVGIPLNLVVKIWKNQQWEVYSSAGGMIEKGLRSVYIQHEHTGNQTTTTSANTAIDGLQWSVNAGLGASYKIQRNLSLYVEPKFSYFFDNNQPICARTDQPIVLGLTAGIRFMLN